jgi:hypothetical protein
MANLDSIFDGMKREDGEGKGSGCGICRQSFPMSGVLFVQSPSHPLGQRRLSKEAVTHSQYGKGKGVHSPGMKRRPIRLNLKRLFIKHAVIQSI